MAALTIFAVVTRARMVGRRALPCCRFGDRVVDGPGSWLQLDRRRHIAADLTIAGTAAAGRRRRFHFTELPPRRLDQIDLMPARAPRARVRVTKQVNARGIPERPIKLDLRDLKAQRCVEALSRHDPGRSKPDKT
jgi:hypothetical protein